MLAAVELLLEAAESRSLLAMYLSIKYFGFSLEGKQFTLFTVQKIPTAKATQNLPSPTSAPNLHEPVYFGPSTAHFPLFSARSP